MPYEKRASVLQLGESTENTFFGCLGWLRILFKLENLLLVDLFSNKTKKDIKPTLKFWSKFTTSTSVLNLTNSTSISLIINIHNGIDLKRRLHFYAPYIVMYQSNRSFNIPPGIPRAFDAFSCPVGWEFDHPQRVGNLITSLDIMLRVALISRGFVLSWRRRRRQTLMNSKEKITYSWRIGWKPKAYTSYVLYLKVFMTDFYLYLNR